MLPIVAFALTALLLTAVGVAGVVACSVSRRTREIGIRLTLGASSLDILRLVMQDSLCAAIVSGVPGIGGAQVFSKLIASQLYGIRIDDPATYLLSALVLIAIVLTASYIPARKACRIDPLIARDRNDHGSHQRCGSSFAAEDSDALVEIA